MKKLSRNEAEEFARAFRCSSESKLPANDCLKLKSSLYTDYLKHVKKYASPSKGRIPIKEQKINRGRP